MKKAVFDCRFLGLILASLLWGGAPALAQEEMENEFSAQKRNIEAARAAAGAMENEGTAETESPEKKKVEDPIAAIRAAAARGGSPLGPGGALPTGSPLPSQAYALGGVQQTPEEAMAQMEAEAKIQEQKMKEQLFERALEGLLPLTSGQTRRVLEVFKDSREAAETPISDPVARTRVESISLDPSEAPAVIQTSPGHVTTVTIVDMTGAPWAIQDVSWAGKFVVTTPEEGGHVIRITPQSAHGIGNISIRLVDLITPITFRVNTGLEEVDYRFDARIPKAGPLAKTPLIEYGGLSTVAGTDENLMRVLDGTGVDQSQKLKVEGADGATTAMRVDGIIYLRTPLTLLSPAWESSASSADGMNVYTLQDVPVVLLSDRGRMVKARILEDIAN